jgi:hypothetical protein
MSRESLAGTCRTGWSPWFFKARAAGTPTGIMNDQIGLEPSDYFTFFNQATTDTIAVYQTEKGDRKRRSVHQVFAPNFF